MNKNLKAIELDKVLKKLAEETAFKASTEKALELLPDANLAVISIPGAYAALERAQTL